MAELIVEVLTAIAAGYPCGGFGDRYVCVENPGFQEDGGSNPKLIFDTWTLRAPSEASSPAPGMDSTTSMHPLSSEQRLSSEIAPWPPVKKALWNVLMSEQLNDGHYIKAFDLIEKLYAAYLAAPDPAQSVRRCARCGSAGDTYVLCSGCGMPESPPYPIEAVLRECASRCRYDGDLFHDQGNIERRDAAWKASGMAEAALSSLSSTDYCTPDGPANCEAWAVEKRCPSCPVSSTNGDGAAK